VSVDDEARLLAAFRALGAPDRHALQVYAEFLALRRPAAAADGEAIDDGTAAAPQPEARPDGETVVMAIKRLTRSYPMIDRRKLMGPTSLLMSQHALQGRAATEVIDELELVFERHHHEITGRNT
jgi:hypothetical protein